MGDCTLGNAINVLQDAFDHLDIRLTGHSEKVAYIFWKLLSLSNDYSSDEIIDLTVLAFFHDIGAYKTEKLDKADKFELINSERHSIYGYLFLKYLSPFNKKAEVTLYHHHKGNEYIDTEYMEEANILRFADKLERLIREGVDINYGSVVKEEDASEYKVNVQKFIKYNDEHKIVEKVKVGAYKEEFYQFLNTIKLKTNQVIKIVRMLVFVIDFRSPQTVNHSIIVAVVSGVICDIFKVNQETRNRVELAAFTHDIGKITTPYDILEKKGKLTEEEMEIMKKHVVESSKIIKGFGLNDIVELVEQHHERLDGSGYPYGLTEEEISFEARLVMVVDIFGALIGKRSYKEQFPKNIIVNILNNLVEENKIDRVITKAIIDNYEYISNCINSVCNEYNDLYNKIDEEFISLSEKALLNFKKEELNYKFSNNLVG